MIKRTQQWRTHHSSAASQNQHSDGHPTESVVDKGSPAGAHVEESREDVGDDRARHCSEYAEQSAEYRQRSGYAIRDCHNRYILQHKTSVRELLRNKQMDEIVVEPCKCSLARDHLPFGGKTNGPQTGGREIR
jgi:hypothetical protein